MYKKVIGESIKKARKANGLTQSQLAEMVGLSVNMIGNIERGKAYPRIEKFIKIYDVTHFSLSHIFVNYNQNDDKRNIISFHDDEKRMAIKLCEYIMQTISDSNK